MKSNRKRKNKIQSDEVKFPKNFDSRIFIKPYIDFLKYSIDMRLSVIDNNISETLYIYYFEIKCKKEQSYYVLEDTLIELIRDIPIKIEIFKTMEENELYIKYKKLIKMRIYCCFYYLKDMYTFYGKSKKSSDLDECIPKVIKKVDEDDVNFLNDLDPLNNLIMSV